MQTNIETTEAEREAAVKASKASKATAKPAKATAKPAKASKASKAKGGGGKALSDFKDNQKIKVIKKTDIKRVDCFRSGQTVAANLTAQKKAGFRGRRKYLRRQIAMKRVSVS